MGKQVEWFSNRSGNMLRILAEGEGRASWHYAILKRDRKGDFHARKVMSNFFALEDARVDLRLSMVEIEKVERLNRGRTMFGLSSVPAESLVLNHER